MLKSTEAPSNAPLCPIHGTPTFPPYRDSRSHLHEFYYCEDCGYAHDLAPDSSDEDFEEAQIREHEIY